MSLQFDATTDYARYVDATNVASNAFTLLVQVRFETGNSGAGWIAVVGKGSSTVATGVGYWVHGVGFQLAGYINGNLDDVFTPTLQQWYQLELVQGGSNDSGLYIYDGTTRTTLRYRTDAAGSYEQTELAFGAQPTSRNGNANGFKGQLRYGKYWKAKLTEDERNTERTSATCVKSGGVCLWSMPDGTTGTDSISGYTLSITSGATGASEPSYIGSATPIAAIAGRTYARMRQG